MRNLIQSLAPCCLATVLVSSCGGPDLTCGRGTQEDNGMCVGIEQPAADAGNAPADAGGAPIDTGSAPADTGSAPTDAGPPPVDSGPPPADTGAVADAGAQSGRPRGRPFESVEVTHLAVNYDVSRPVFVGNNLPVSIGITSRDQGAPTPRRVLFTVDLLEELPPNATPAQRQQQARCALGFFDVTLTPNGREEVFEREFPVPRECATRGAGMPRTFNLAVVVDTTAFYFEQPQFRAFTEAERANATGHGPRCRNDLSPTGTARGCVYRVQVDGAPGVNVSTAALNPDSRVAVLWPRPGDVAGSGVRDPSATRTSRPPARAIDPGEDALVTVNMNLEAFGLNPYRHDDANEALPSNVAIAYSIAPVTAGLTEGRPLTMRSRERGTAQTVPSHDFGELGSAETNNRVHDLYPTDEVYDLLNTGAWRNETLFRVQGCVTPTFREGGNQGNLDTTRRPNDLAADNCREFTVRLVRSRAEPNAATTYALNYNYNRTYGSPATEGLSIYFNTANEWTLARGAKSFTTAYINTIGFLRLPVFNATVNAEATRELAGSYYDVRLMIFGVPYLSRSGRWNNGITPYNENFSLSLERCVDFSYPVAPGVNIVVEGCISGTMGVQATLNITGALTGSTEFPSAYANMNITATGRPYAEAGAEASAGISIGADVGGIFGATVFSGGVRGVLDLVSYSMPVTPGLRFGYYRPSTGYPAGQLRVVGTTRVDSTLEYLGGEVLVEGRAGCVQVFWWEECAWEGESTLWDFTPTTSSLLLYNTSRSLYTLY